MREEMIKTHEIAIRKMRKYLRSASDSWRLNETYLKIKGENHRMVKYLNNIVEQDHRLIKRVMKPGLKIA